MYHDCSLICFQWLAGASESLFYIRVRPRGSKQRQPVVMHSSSPLISCVVGRVSQIPPDSCHSPSQCTIVDSDTHRLPHQNNCRSRAHALSHLREIASVKYIMLVSCAETAKTFSRLSLGFVDFAGKSSPASSVGTQISARG